MPRQASGALADDLFIPPALLVEIRSPEQGLAALVERCQWYVAHAVVAALLIDPRDRTVRLFRTSQPPVTLRGADPIDLDAVLPGFDLTVVAWFAALAPP
jgi:Uma2 family endonuclease